MLTNYFKTALRYLVKNRTFALINIFGLTVGFLSFMFIALYLHDELNFDMFHSGADRMYRILQHEKQEDGQIRNVATVAARIGPEAAKQLPEVEDAIRISGLGRLTVGNDPANRDYESIIIADPNFFSFFDFDLLEGEPKNALTQNNTVVLSQTLAKKYFGNGSALGKSLWTNAREVTVSGVMKDSPKNSHIQLDLIFSEITWANFLPWYTKFADSDWNSNSYITYIKCKPGIDKTTLEKKLTELVRENYTSDKEFKSNFSLQPFDQIHLYSDNIQGLSSNEVGPKPFYLYMFAAVGFLILLIACLNYMNLSTAAAYQRTKEIGTRKTLGAAKAQLMVQFLGEAVILSVVSLLIAVGLLQLLLPVVNEFTQKAMVVSLLPLTWTFALCGTMLLAGMLSSLYPAFIIARVSPVEAIKKEIKIASRSIPIRKVLVIAQFSISIMMISSTLVIYRQLQFMRQKELGFNLEDLFVADINSGSLRRNYQSIKQEFESLSEVQSVTVSSRVPGEWKSFPIASVKESGKAIGYDMIYVGIDQDFLKTYNIKLLEGRNFSTNAGDSLKVMLTKLAVEQLGLDNPVGQIVEIPAVRWGGSINELKEPFRAEVIGVVDNFYFESFRQKMMPLVFAYSNNPIHSIDYYTLRIKTTDWEETIKKLKAANNKFDADSPLEYTFLNGRFQEFYQADVKRGQIFLIFSCIIVLIACLGLFALVSFSIESRRKEIGIRKVLGASVQSIVGMVSKEFLLLVLAATIISIPIAYYLIKAWLEDFAYHITLGMGTFVMSGLIALAIAFITISFRSINAAIANPVNSLRNE